MSSVRRQIPKSAILPNDRNRTLTYGPEVFNELDRIEALVVLQEPLQRKRQGLERLAHFRLIIFRATLLVSLEERRDHVRLS